MKPTAIVTAFDKGLEHKVKEAAERTILCEDLYREWSEFYKKNKKTWR